MTTLRHRLIQGLTMLGVLLLSGCGTITKTYPHPMVRQNLNEPYAAVYFIRPNTEHVQGFPDNNLTVEIDGQQILSLAKGEYTLLNLKPWNKISVTLRNLTQVRGRWEITPEMRSSQIDFLGGQTYFIVTQPVDGEFRGVYFRPELVDLERAKQITTTLKPAGAAVRHPISIL